MPLSFASCIAHALTRSLAHARPCLPPSSPFRTQEAAEIEDATQTNLVNLRRTIYLTIMSSLDFEEVRCKGYWLCYTLYRLCYTLYRLCYTLYRLCYTEEVGCKGYRLQGVLAARGVGYRLQGVSEAARDIRGCKGYRRLQGVSEAARGIGGCKGYRLCYIRAGPAFAYGGECILWARNGEGLPRCIYMGRVGSR